MGMSCHDIKERAIVCPSQAEDHLFLILLSPVGVLLKCIYLDLES